MCAINLVTLRDQFQDILATPVQLTDAPHIKIRIKCICICESIPTDIIMILKNDTNLDKFKNEMIAKLKQLGFTPKISTISGGESINFESTVQTKNNGVAFRIPVKLYIRNRKPMVQGTPDCQTFFIKHFRDLNNKSEPDESRKNTISEEQKPNKVQDSLPKPTLPQKSLSSSRLSGYTIFYSTKCFSKFIA